MSRPTVHHLFTYTTLFRSRPEIVFAPWFVLRSRQAQRWPQRYQTWRRRGCGRRGIRTEGRRRAKARPRNCCNEPCKLHGQPPTHAPTSPIIGLYHTLGSGSRRTPKRSATDRKSTRLNSSHVAISYAVF